MSMDVVTGVQSSDSDGETDCFPLTFDVCSSGQVRLHTGACSSPASACTAQCGVGVSYIFNSRLGVCECTSAPSAAAVCNASCAAALTRTTLTSTTLTLTYPATSFNASTSVSIPIAALPGLVGSLFCSPTLGTCGVVSLESSAAGTRGLLDASTSLLTVTGGRTRSSRRLQAGVAAIGVAQPWVCMYAGDALLWSLTGGAIPTFEAASSLNSVPDFDRAPFRALAAALARGDAVSLFGVTLPVAGVYVFSTSSSPAAATVVRVIPRGTTCDGATAGSNSSGAAAATISYADSATVAQVAADPSAVTALNPNWTLIAALCGAMLALVLVVVSALVWFRHANVRWHQRGKSNRGRAITLKDVYDAPTSPVSVTSPAAQAAESDDLPAVVNGLAQMQESTAAALQEHTATCHDVEAVVLREGDLSRAHMGAAVAARGTLPAAESAARVALMRHTRGTLAGDAAALARAATHIGEVYAGVDRLAAVFASDASAVAIAEAMIHEVGAESELVVDAPSRSVSSSVWTALQPSVVAVTHTLRIAEDCVAAAQNTGAFVSWLPTHMGETGLQGSHPAVFSALTRALRHRDGLAVQLHAGRRLLHTCGLALSRACSETEDSLRACVRACATAARTRNPAIIRRTAESHAPHVNAALARLAAAVSTLYTRGKATVTDIQASMREYSIATGEAQSALDAALVGADTAMDGRSMDVQTLCLMMERLESALTAASRHAQRLDSDDLASSDSGSDDGDGVAAQQPSSRQPVAPASDSDAAGDTVVAALDTAAASEATLALEHSRAIAANYNADPALSDAMRRRLLADLAADETALADALTRERARQRAELDAKLEARARARALARARAQVQASTASMVEKHTREQQALEGEMKEEEAGAPSDVDASTSDWAWDGLTVLMDTYTRLRVAADSCETSAHAARVRLCDAFARDAAAMMEDAVSRARTRAVADTAAALANAAQAGAALVRVCEDVDAAVAAAVEEVRAAGSRAHTQVNERMDAAAVHVCEHAEQHAATARANIREAYERKVRSGNDLATLSTSYTHALARVDTLALEMAHIHTRICAAIDAERVRAHALVDDAVEDTIGNVRVALTHTRASAAALARLHAQGATPAAAELASAIAAASRTADEQAANVTASLDSAAAARAAAVEEGLRQIHARVQSTTAATNARALSNMRDTQAAAVAHARVATQGGAVPGADGPSIVPMDVKVLVDAVSAAETAAEALREAYARERAAEDAAHARERSRQQTQLQLKLAQRREKRMAAVHESAFHSSGASGSDAVVEAVLRVDEQLQMDEARAVSDALAQSGAALAAVETAAVDSRQAVQAAVDRVYDTYAKERESALTRACAEKERQAAAAQVRIARAREKRREALSRAQARENVTAAIGAGSQEANALESARSDQSAKASSVEAAALAFLAAGAAHSIAAAPAAAHTVAPSEKQLAEMEAAHAAEAAKAFDETEASMRARAAATIAEKRAELEARANAAVAAQNMGEEAVKRLRAEHEHEIASLTHTLEAERTRQHDALAHKLEARRAKRMNEAARAREAEERERVAAAAAQEAARAAALQVEREQAALHAALQAMRQSGAQDDTGAAAVEAVMKRRHERETNDLMARQYTDRSACVRAALEDVQDKKRLEMAEAVEVATRRGDAPDVMDATLVAIAGRYDQLRVTAEKEALERLSLQHEGEQLEMRQRQLSEIASALAKLTPEDALRRAEAEAELRETEALAAYRAAATNKRAAAVEQARAEREAAEAAARAAHEAALASLEAEHEAKLKAERERADAQMRARAERMRAQADAAREAKLREADGADAATRDRLMQEFEAERKAMDAKLELVRAEQHARLQAKLEARRDKQKRMKEEALATALAEQEEKARAAAAAATAAAVAPVPTPLKRAASTVGAAALRRVVSRVLTARSSGTEAPVAPSPAPTAASPPTSAMSAPRSMQDAVSWLTTRLSDIEKSLDSIVPPPATASTAAASAPFDASARVVQMEQLHVHERARVAFLSRVLRTVSASQRGLRTGSGTVVPGTVTVVESSSSSAARAHMQGGALLLSRRALAHVGDAVLACMRAIAPATSTDVLMAAVLQELFTAAAPALLSHADLSAGEPPLGTARDGMGAPPTRARLWQTTPDVTETVAVDLDTASPIAAAGSSAAADVDVAAATMYEPGSLAARVDTLSRTKKRGVASYLARLEADVLESTAQLADSGAAAMPDSGAAAMPVETGASATVSATISTTPAAVL